MNRSTFDAVASLDLGHQEYALAYALVAQKRDDVAPGYKLRWTKRSGWALTFNGVVTTSGDAGRVYDVARRTPMNELLRRGFELRELAHRQVSAAVEL